MDVMAGTSIAMPSQKLLSPTSTTTTRLSSSFSTRLFPNSETTRHSIVHANRTRTSRISIGCKAAAAETVEEVSKAKKGSFKIESLTSWLLEQQRVGSIDAELTTVITSISLACKQISSLLQRANISKLTGSQGTINIQGEDQAKLDVIANEVFCNCLRSTGLTGIIASEEEEIPIAVEETYSGNYIVVFDPIDGSSNIDTSLTTGSIFGIYDSSNNYCLADPDEENDEITLSSGDFLDQRKQNCIVSVCQPGSNLLAAGYCLYSSSVVFTLSLGQGVFSFTLDPLYRDFVLTQENIQIPKSGKIYSFNESNYELWDEKLKKYIDDIRVDTEKRYSARYIGCLVGEIHRTLLYGGIYGNPSNVKSKKGNLRLLYECAPMSYLVEQAGGRGSDGRRRILDIEPEEVHQRVPFLIGSPEEVDKLEKYLT